MKVKDLIVRLQKLNPEAEVVKFDRHYMDSYNSVHFIEGTHSYHEDDRTSFGQRLVPGRRKFVKGKGKPDWQCAAARSKSKHQVDFVVFD